VRRPVYLAPDSAPDAFPPVSAALEDPPGLLAVGGDLSVARLAAAYRQGIFPWYAEGQPILWWTPDPRMVLFPAEVRVRRSLDKRLRNGAFVLRADTAFAAVLDGCAAPRRDGGGTWLDADMRGAYLALHAAGLAHSVEAWRYGELVGGLYGVALGGVFFGESMFSREPDASKVALVTLARWWQRQGGVVIDCQLPNPHLVTLGARLIPRAAFQDLLHTAVDAPLRADWAGFPGAAPP
jgi:leucyl/phenylalanyl-tRNA--protein transferase